ncbi:MAG: Fur family transcriptional regulator [Christensenellales bacterium]|jgi:Fur family ferric uptake transcriptional regulator
MKDWPAGLKRTKQRELVLGVLREAVQPMSAMDISIAIEKKGTPVWLSTIYRVLDSFEQADLVVKVTVMNSEMTLYELNRHQHKHYAVCVDCNKVIQMNNCPIEQFVPELAESDFEITGHNLEIFGHCGDCAKGESR